MNLPFHIDLSAGGPKRPYPRPARDWLMLLALALLALLASMFYNFYLYRAAQDGTLGGSAAAPASGLDPALIGKVNAVFSARAAQMTEYENGAHSFIDPSP